MLGSDLGEGMGKGLSGFAVRPNGEMRGNGGNVT
jgi:hypothetical protein